LNILTKGGEERTILLSADAVRDAEGEIVHSISIQRDITERKRAEEALKESKERFRALTESTSDWVWEVDENAAYRYASPKVKELLGYDPEEIIGKTPFDLMTPEDAKRVAAEFGAVVEAQKPFDRLENVNMHKDGRIVLLETSGVPIFDAGGKFQGYRGIDRDITERKKMEQRLQEKTELFDAILSNVPICVSRLDSNGTHTLSLGSGLKRVGLKENQLIGVNIYETYPHIKKYFKKAVEEGIAEFEDGGIYEGKPWYFRTWLFCSKAIGKGFFSISVDVTERKRAGEALRESEERLSSFMDSATDGFFLYDSELNYVDFNRAGVEIFSLNREDTIGKNLLDIVPNLKETGRYDRYMEVIKTGKPFFVDDIVPHPKFGDKHLAVRAFKVGDGLGIITTDITEHKKADEQIKASLKEKEILLKEVHHRVKNNLQVISSLLNLQSRYLKDKQGIEVFKDSQNRVRSIALVHEKLYQSKDLTRLNFAEYIQNLTSHLFHSYGVNSDTITLKINTHDASLDLDTAIPCGLIINELVSNSLKHAFPAGKKGEISIDLHSDNENRFTLIVSDNGVGFPKDLDFRNTESLGLQLVTTLTNQLDGSIELDSSGGTTFRIRFAKVK